jgi:hypothetical protein
MAVTVTIVYSGRNRKRVTVIADSDADTQAVITHSLEPAESNPEVELTPILAAARTSAWIVLSRDSTQVTVGKGTGGGSGSVTEQLEVVIFRPHSIVGPHA